jgi:transposase-like protein
MNLSGRYFPKQVILTAVRWYLRYQAIFVRKYTSLLVFSSVSGVVATVASFDSAPIATP